VLFCLSSERLLLRRNERKRNRESSLGSKREGTGTYAMAIMWKSANGLEAWCGISASRNMVWPNEEI